jgi:hypothetical protein
MNVEMKDLKTLLQNGTVVKLRNGFKLLVVDKVLINDKFTLVTNLSCYHSTNLKSNFSKDLDIMKVETIMDKVIWSREEDDYLKLIKEEIDTVDKQLKQLWLVRNNLCEQLTRLQNKLKS